MESLNLDGKRVLEFGSGHSTEYFHRRGCHVTSYGREKYWIKFLKKKVSSRTQIRHFKDGSKDGNKEYFSDIRKSLSNEQFDIFDVDVYPRPLTFEYYASLVKDGGIIIFDNVNAYSGPFYGDNTLLFTVNEGTKAQLFQEQGEWLEIVILNGGKAWVPKDKIRIL